jgi:hypothetical protein
MSAVQPIMAAVTGLILSLVTMSLVGALFLTAPGSLAVDHTGPFAALGKSFHIATANFKAHCVSYLFMQLIPIILLAPWLIIVILQEQGALGLHFSPAIIDGVSAFCSIACSVVTLAVYAGYVSLVYLDGRCRQEHFDLLLLARDLGMGEQVEQAFLHGPAVFTAPSFPNYALAGVPNSAATTNTAPINASTFATPIANSSNPQVPPVTVAYPDYSAPPPPEPAPESAAEPFIADIPAPQDPTVAAAHPDYSVPPPSVPAPESALEEENPHVS